MAAARGQSSARELSVNDRRIIVWIQSVEFFHANFAVDNEPGSSGEKSRIAGRSQTWSIIFATSVMGGTFDTVRTS